MADGEITPKFEPWGFAAKTSAAVIAEGEREWAKTNSRVRYQDMRACDQFDIMQDIEKIQRPALIVCGREDVMTPLKYSEFLNKKITGSKLEVIENAGHLVMLESPSALGRAILKFLEAL